MIIVLNGPSSAGKSTLARAIQRRSKRTFLLVQLDRFIEMLPLDRINDPQNFQLIKIADANPAEVAIETGSNGQRLVTAMRASIGAIAAEGFDILVDDVVFDGDIGVYRKALPGQDVRLVGVFCDLNERERREKARGDRQIGQTRWQEGRVHQGAIYDLKVDTTTTPASDCARTICDAFDL